MEDFSIHGSSLMLAYLMQKFSLDAKKSG